MEGWPATVRSMQKGWIGRSNGSRLDFEFEADGHKLSVEIFTTRIDTLFGVSYIAISPESTILDDYLSQSEMSEIQKVRQ